MEVAGAAAVLLALVHVVARRFEEALSVVPRSRWLSVAGGVSVAYVFVHLLPRIAASQAALDREGGLLTGIEGELWLGALTGLVGMYGLERLAINRRESSPKRVGRADATAWVHLGSYALYNAIAGYVLLEEAERGATGLALYTIALGVHFVVNDHGLVEHHGPLYRSWGRWLLAAAVLLGWSASVIGSIGGATVPVLIGFLGGGIVLNVLKEELPEQRQSRFASFMLAAAGYAALLSMI